jgi:Phytanoyl-CoA dioxygenase (PhyH)
LAHFNLQVCNQMTSNITKFLHAEGYLLIKNVLTPDEITQGQSSIVGDRVDYGAIQNFLDNSMMAKMDKILGWDSTYTKYRVSDNNNSADASAFHRDLNCQDPFCDTFRAPDPIYTCLTYFDTTTMELIPRSHLKHSFTYSEAITLLKNTKTVEITVEPGDILVFHATLIHRGIFTEQLSHRRVLQVFDVFPSKHDFHRYSQQIIHVLGKEKHSAAMVYMSKIPLIINCINLVGYLNAATGYGWSKKENAIDACGLAKQIRYISSEGLRGRLHPQTSGEHEINKYIIKNPTIDLDEDLYDTFNFYCYTRQYTLYTFIVILLIVVLILAFKTIKNHKIVGK